MRQNKTKDYRIDGKCKSISYIEAAYVKEVVAHPVA
jgi:hypothetical protein